MGNAETRNRTSNDENPGSDAPFSGRHWQWIIGFAIFNPLKVGIYGVNPRFKLIPATWVVSGMGLRLLRRVSSSSLDIAIWVTSPRFIVFIAGFISGKDFKRFVDLEHLRVRSTVVGMARHRATPICRLDVSNRSITWDRKNPVLVFEHICRSLRFARDRASFGNRHRIGSALTLSRRIVDVNRDPALAACCVSETQMLRIIGGNIRAARLVADITQECLAELVGLHWQSISNIERGLNPCGVINFALIAQHLGVSSDSLLEGLPAIDQKRAAKIRRALARKRKATS
jgi:DNA-binding XRE family transcriptional regulator